MFFWQTDKIKLSLSKDFYFFFHSLYIFLWEKALKNGSHSVRLKIGSPLNSGLPISLRESQSMYILGVVLNVVTVDVSGSFPFVLIFTSVVLKLASSSSDSVSSGFLGYLIVLGLIVLVLRFLAFEIIVEDVASGMDNVSSAKFIESGWLLDFF